LHYNKCILAKKENPVIEIKDDGEGEKEPVSDEPLRLAAQQFIPTCESGKQMAAVDNDLQIENYSAFQLTPAQKKLLKTAASTQIQARLCDRNCPTVSWALRLRNSILQFGY
jgi:hypothetical protein